MTRLKTALKPRVHKYRSRTFRSFRLTLLALATLLAALTILISTSVAPAFASHDVWDGVDFAWHGNLDPQAFKAAGVDFVVRYLAGGVGGSKELTHYEADMWSKAGVGIVLVWETTASRAGQGYDAGYADASKAFPQAASMGMPDGKPIYFAVDFDAAGTQVEPYFKGIYDWTRSHFSDGHATSRIGVYGSGDVVQYIHDAGYAAYKWQALAWMHGKSWQTDAMQQHTVEVTVGGVDADLDRVATADYGVWFSTCVVNPPKKNKGSDDSSDSDADAPGKSGDTPADRNGHGFGFHVLRQEILGF